LDPLNRRKFLQAASTTATLLAAEKLLTACVSPGNAQPTASSIAVNPLDSTPTEASPTAAPETLSYLAVARNGDPEVMTRRAVAALGGMEKFVPKGSQVVVKPNICVAYHSYEYAATTNPWVIAAIVKMALEAGAKSVQVMDSPFGGTADQAYEFTGIGEQVKAAGGEMVVMKDMQFQEHDIPGAANLKTVSINDLIYNADVLINVPIAKDHSLAHLTLGMKNLMGAIKHRERLHSYMAESLTDLNTILKPQLTIIDAVRILMANGPTGGNLDDVKQTNTVIASADIVAADSFAAGLFGVKPSELGYLVEASKRGIGRLDLENLKIQEINAG
jgi:uncharacterized protein (DUF362 family)